MMYRDKVDSQKTFANKFKKINVRVVNICGAYCISKL